MFFFYLVLSVSFAHIRELQLKKKKKINVVSDILLSKWHFRDVNEPVKKQPTNVSHLQQHKNGVYPIGSEKKLKLQNLSLLF